MYIYIYIYIYRLYTHTVKPTRCIVLRFIQKQCDTAAVVIATPCNLPEEERRRIRHRSICKDVALEDPEETVYSPANTQHALVTVGPSTQATIALLHFTLHMDWHRQIA